MRKITFSLLLLAFTGFAFTGIDTDVTQVKKTAQEQLQVTLGKIPAGQEVNFGFTSRDEFKSAAAGEIYRMITLTSEFFEDEKLADKNYIRIQQEWRVPVVVNGENRALLTVFGQDSTLNVVDIGATMLAKEIQMKSAGQSQKDKFIFRIYPLTMDFIVFVEHGKTLAEGNYYPMNSALMGIPSLDGSMMTQAEVFQQIKKKSNESKNQAR
jgi:hypothetical protein